MIRRHRVFPDIEKEYDRLDRMGPTGDILSQVLEGLLQGRWEYYALWDDLRTPAQNAADVGPGVGATRDTDGTLLFDATALEYASLIQQLPHAWKEGSSIVPHVHWSKTTGVAGDVEWEMRYRIFNVGAAPPTWSVWTAATGRSHDNTGIEQIMVVDSFPEIDMSAFLISCIFSVQLRRNPPAADDTYTGDARLWEFDTHYQIDSLGSIFPFIKGDIGG